MNDDEKILINRERLRKNSRAFYLRHKARLKASEAERFAGLPAESQERILKHRRALCSAWRTKHAGYLLKYRATEKGRTVFQEAAKRAREKRRQLIDKLKSGPCLDCGHCFPPVAMDFDHRDPSCKHFQIAASGRIAEASVLAEVAKCDLVCSNCHRIRETRRRQGLPATLPPPDYEI